MNNRRGQEGFTLVELMVTILCGTIVTAAAVTILLLGLRMNARNTAVAKQQNQIRIVFTMLEEMVAEKAITHYDDSDAADGEQISWSLSGISAKITYTAEDGAIRSGDSVLIEGITSTLSYENRLLTVTVTYEDGTEYSTTLYCRVDLQPEPPAEGSRTLSLRPEQTEEPSTPRGEFLSVLVGEMGSTGKIRGTDMSYSRWYTDQQSGLEWPEDTPWCACFLSWAAAQVSGLDSAPYFARVNDGIWGFSGLVTGNGAQWSGQWHNAGEYVPVAGDFVFFNLDEDVDADHVGAVFSVAGDRVFTIEGNCDGKVAVCSYRLDDPTLVGYGVADWNEG